MAWPSRSQTAAAGEKQVTTQGPAIATAILLGLAPAAAPADVPDYPDLSKPGTGHAPAAEAARFRQAVERGELSLMGQRLDGSQVVAVRVEYVYPLDGTAPAVWVYARLAAPLPVPGQTGCEVRGVRVRLGPGGRIIESEAHVWTR
jgi:hypothetical protein